MHLNGFDGLETSILEHQALYSDTVGTTSDIVSKELFEVRSSRASEESDTVLRPEGTVSVIRALMNAGKIDEGARLYYAGPMFRYARPQKGRFRQFTQLCCEMVNLTGPEYDIEVIYTGYRWLSKQMDFDLHINTLASPESLSKYRAVLLEFFKQNQSKLRAENQNRLSSNALRVLDQLNAEEKHLLGAVPDIYDFISPDDREYMNLVLQGLSKLKVKFFRNPQMVRGLDYYRHTVFEFIKNGQSIGGGGRYVFDRSRFGENKSEITGAGYGIGLERIWSSLTNAQLLPMHVIQVSDLEYAIQIGNILTQNRNRYSFVYGGLDKGFKLAAKIKAKSIISFDQNNIRDQTINYKTQDGNKILNIVELVEILERC